MERLGSSREAKTGRGSLLWRIIRGDDPAPEADDADLYARHTGYYVTGPSWPADSNDIPIADIYQALDGITDPGEDATAENV